LKDASTMRATRSSSDSTCSEQIILFIAPQTKKSKGVGDLADHVTGPPRPIHLSIKRYAVMKRRRPMVLTLRVLVFVPSFIKQIYHLVISSSCIEVSNDKCVCMVKKNYELSFYSLCFFSWYFLVLILVYFFSFKIKFI